MINRLLQFARLHRYRIALFTLMTVASAVCFLLLAARIEYSDTRQYTGLRWNLFLAWIPFALAYLAHALSGRRLLLYVTIPVMAFLWLIFFPNAPYILTDLQYLSLQTPSAPVWYDVIMLIWFSWTGLLLGLISLYFMHEIVQRAFGRAAGWIFILAVSGLGSFGVYVGRFVRLNSWDLLQDTREAAVSILGLVIDPSLRMLAFTSLFAVFYLFVYLTLYSFGHLLQERPVRSAARTRQ